MKQPTHLPTIKPLLPQLRTEPFDNEKWSFEFKYDGFRGLLHIEEGIAWFISKKKKHLPRFDSLARKVAKELKATNVILDGEIVVFDATTRPMFMELMRSKREPRYVAFDILWLDGRDLRQLPLVTRRKYLMRVLPKTAGPVSSAFSVKGKGKRMFALMCEHDLEGMIAKRFKDPYSPEVEWYKIKNKNYSQLKGRAQFFRKKN